MALFRYFATSADTVLPDPRGPLTRQIPSTAIASANGEVRQLLQAQQAAEPVSATKRGSYVKFTPEQKAEVGKRAAEHGVAATVRYFGKRFPGLKESSVRTWRNAYTLEIKKRRREGRSCSS